MGGLVPKVVDYQTYEQHQGEDIHKDTKSYPETSNWLSEVTLPRNNIFNSNACWVSGTGAARMQSIQNRTPEPRNPGTLEPLEPGTLTTSTKCISLMLELAGTAHKRPRHSNQRKDTTKEKSIKEKQEEEAGRRRRRRREEEEEEEQQEHKQ